MKTLLLRLIAATVLLPFIGVTAMSEDADTEIIFSRQWAERVFSKTSGQPEPGTDLPFSFRYDGQHCASPR